MSVGRIRSVKLTHVTQFGHNHILLRLLTISRMVNAIRWEFNSLGVKSPPCRPSLHTILLGELLTWPPKRRKLQEQTSNIGIALDYDVFHGQIQRLWCFHRILAIDDDLENPNCTEAILIDHLASCLIAIVLGRQKNSVITPQALLGEIAHTGNFLATSDRRRRIQLLLLSHAEALICNSAIDWHRTPVNILQRLMLESNSRIYIYNKARLCASFLIGRHYEHLLQYLNHSSCPREMVRWHSAFFWTNILDAASGQILSIRQRQLRDISLDLYLDLAVSKSNSYMDLVYSYRYLIRQSAFWKSHMNSTRYCEQIYLDDLIDLA